MWQVKAKEAVPVVHLVLSYIARVVKQSLIL